MAKSIMRNSRELHLKKEKTLYEVLGPLGTHPLKSADALQLAAALVWAGNTTRDHHFVCLDKRLRKAAGKEGFRILPEEIQ